MRFPSFFTAMRCRKALIGALASGGVLMAAVQPAQAIIPVLTISNDTPNYTNPDFLGDSSFGYAFDLQGTTIVDAVGLYAPKEWTKGSYTVTLWSYKPEPPDTLVFKVEASEIFDAALLNTYPIVGSYAWIPISPLTLTGTPGNPDEGYFISAIGSFLCESFDMGGKCASSTLQGAYTTSTYSFASPFFTEENRYSYDTDAVYPLPFFIQPSVSTNGFFNPNLSLVPGPLPVLGAAAGFGWTRRLRKRIRASK